MIIVLPQMSVEWKELGRKVFKDQAKATTVCIVAVSSRAFMVYSRSYGSMAYEGCRAIKPGNSIIIACTMQSIGAHSSVYYAEPDGHPNPPECPPLHNVVELE